MKIQWREVTGYLLLILAACFWGGAASLGKKLFQAGISTPMLMQARSILTAFIFFVLLSVFARQHLRIQVRALPGLLLLAIPGIVLVNISYYQAIKMMPVAVAVFIQFSAPILVFLYGWITGNEKGSRAKFAAMALSIVGTFFMVQIQKAEWKQLPAFGLICAFTAMVSYAFYLVVSHKLSEKHSAYTLVAYGYGLAALFWLIALNPLKTIGLIADQNLWLPTFLFALFSTLIPFTLFMLGIRRVSPTGAAIASTTETLTATLFAFFFLGETLQPAQIVGGLLILCALILLILQPKSSKITGEIRSVE